MIKLENIAMRFGKVKALTGVSFSIPDNSVTGIIGPNGSGKSTMIKIISGLIKTYDGEVLFNEFNRTDISVSSEDFGVPSYYSVRKVLKLFSLIKGGDKEQVEQIIELLQLNNHIEKKFGNLSQGWKQRLNIACALIGNGKCIILDEPTNGLDPDGFKLLRKIVADLHGSGKTVIIASHFLSEVERICTDIAFLKEGRLVMHGSLNTILGDHHTLEQAYDYYS
jgi:ABC-type multidrug transport system ATPase subunit